MSAADIKGYYARLGLTNAATFVEIKQAFRRLAKETHPDSGGRADGGARFRAISEAYAVLSDPTARARYDSQGATHRPRTSAQTTIEPVICSVCSRVTAQPRYLVFRNVISVILVTTRNPIQGIYCSTCAKAVALKATLLTAVAGWWGVPWGPIFTIVEGLRNGVGGANIKENEERLLWHNAVAFAYRGDASLAYGLAKRVEFAADPEIAGNAKRLMEHLRAGGTPANTELKDVWHPQPAQFLIHLTIIAALPLLITLLIVIGSGGGPLPQVDQTPRPDYVAPPYEGLPEANAMPAPDTSGNPASPPVLDYCLNMPSTGARLAGRRLSGSGHVLEIDNGADGDAIVKIRNADSGRMVTSFFVAQNTQARITGIPDGRYRIQYAFGPALAANCTSFTSITSAGEFPGTETLMTERQEEELGTRVRRMRLSYTLYSVPNGNTQPSPIDAVTFESN